MRTDTIVILLLAVLVVACDDEAQTAGPPAGLRPISVRVDGPTEVAPAAEVQFTALQSWSDGSTRDVTAIAQWVSTNPSVLSVSEGLAKALTPGEVGVSAHIGQLPVNPKTVRVVPAAPEWNGLYTLNIGGGTCNEALPLEPGVRRRTYTATLTQNGLTLRGNVSNVGGFEGRIINPEVRFSIARPGGLSRRVQRAAILEPRFHLFVARRAAYSGDEQFVELIDQYHLVITGQAVTTMSSSGFVGRLNGTLALQGPRGQVIGVCSSSSHEFTLFRR